MKPLILFTISFVIILTVPCIIIGAMLWSVKKHKEEFNEIEKRKRKYLTDE